MVGGPENQRAGLVSVRLVIVRLMMIDTVLDEAHDQRKTSARRYSSQSLHDGIIRGADLVQAAIGRYHGHGKLLQEIAAQTAPDRTGGGVPEKSETVLPGRRRRKMRAKNARDNLNNEIG
jgi:hypothetical protein